MPLKLKIIILKNLDFFYIDEVIFLLKIVDIKEV